MRKVLICIILLVLVFNAQGLRKSRPTIVSKSRSRILSLHVTPGDADAGSPGVVATVEYFNSEEGQNLARRLVEKDPIVVESLKGSGFWGNSGFINKVQCKGVKPTGLVFDVEMGRGSTLESQQVEIGFIEKVEDETQLKLSLINLVAEKISRKSTAAIATLPFGQDVTVPNDFRFNQCPHPTWVRAYIYDRVSIAVLRALEDNTISKHTRSRMRIVVNFPELNPKYDVFRVGTMAEMVRETCLRVAEGGSRCRIIVQQSLGEGIFTGTPLALSMMMPVFQKMDWGTSLTEEELYQGGDMLKPTRPESKIRLGRVGPEYVAPDDDVIFIIMPQNVVNGELTGMLDDMCSKAESQGTAVILINDNLADRPSGNNKMQIRGRAERRAVQDSFSDIFQLRLLYPSNGGYMYPIAGLVSKKDYRSPYVAFNIKRDKKLDREYYTVVGAWGPHSPPQRTDLADLFL